jgi:hypothetical protein
MYFSRIKNISFLKILILLFGGALILAFIAYTRTLDSNLSFLERGFEQFQFDFIGMDLIRTNRNLFQAYDYVQNNNITYGSTLSADFFGIVPLLAGFVEKVSGLTLTTSSAFLTYLEFSVDAPFGVGSNMVGDLYLSFGIIGVMIFPFILGFFVRKMELYFIYQKGDISNLAYLCCISNAVFKAFNQNSNLSTFGVNIPSEDEDEIINCLESFTQFLTGNLFSFDGFSLTTFFQVVNVLEIIGFKDILRRSYPLPIKFKEANHFLQFSFASSLQTHFQSAIQAISSNFINSI